MGIVCHTHKFIFIKPHKVAGTAILVALSKYCQKGDHISVSGASKEQGLPDWFVPQIQYPIDAHDTPQKIRSIVGYKIWNEYKKISCVRNPWDKTISLHHHRQKIHGAQFISRPGQIPLEASRELTFDEFIFMDGEVPQDNYYFIYGKPCIDLLMRYENLQSEWKILLDLLRLPYQDLPMIMAGIRPPNEDYRSYYSEATKLHVYNINKLTCDTYGYTFEEEGGV
jgi:hypothetical protein